MSGPIRSQVVQTHGALRHPDRVDPSAPIDYRYEAIIDMMLAAPHLTKGEIADRVGYTRAYFSTLTGSDAFRARLAFRRAEHQERLGDELVSKLYDVSAKALDRVGEALDNPEVEPAFALSAAATTLRELGFGPKKPAATHIELTQNNIVQNAEDQAASDAVAQARERMAAVSRITLQEAEVVEGEFTHDDALVPVNAAG